MKVIGFTAKIGGGKDTAGKIITEALEEKGYRVTILSFANPLKSICTLLFGWDYKRLLNDNAYKEGNTLDDGSPDPACVKLGMTRRVAMQLIGTEAMRRGLHPDIWIIALELAIMRGEYDDYDYGLLTDCRFLNELQFVRDLDGTLIQLKRVGEQSTLTDQTQHVSELEWEKWQDWDAVITNYIDPDLDEDTNLMALRNKLEDAIGYQDIPEVGLVKALRNPSYAPVATPHNWTPKRMEGLEDRWRLMQHKTYYADNGVPNGSLDMEAENDNEEISDTHWDKT